MANSSIQQSTVAEFTCLWTQRKTQKLKNWQDGFLRFHEFNHRAMVYDDNRRLIDDLFMPHVNQISSGDELEFSRMLVTVEDELGKVTQDLTPLYQRQNARREAEMNQTTLQPFVQRPANNDQAKANYPIRMAHQRTVPNSRNAQPNTIRPGFGPEVTSNARRLRPPLLLKRQRVPTSEQEVSALADMNSSDVERNRAGETKRDTHQCQASKHQPLPSYNETLPHVDPVNQLPATEAMPESLKQVPPSVQGLQAAQPASKAGQELKKIVLSMPKDSLESTSTYCAEDEVIDAWTPEESEDLFGDRIPEVVVSRMNRDQG